ncbi:MAG: YdiU family protein [Sphingobacteriia bacterium]|nr:YdiU family protein [Sphingobacteriia bacterium]
MEKFCLNFENKYASLPSDFYTKMLPEKVSKKPFLVHANKEAAKLIDLDPATFLDKNFVEYFAGNKQLQGSENLAMVYAGHQFGYYVPKLGDGRAILLGQVRNKNGELVDIQLKGSGKTPYSRFADGRAVMRSSIREYLCSEAMFGLSIPTTRALCVIGTNEPVMREGLEPGAIVTRISTGSNIRFGHFEYFYYSGKPEALKQLIDHVITEYFHISPNGNYYIDWFKEVVSRTAKLIANWQAVGFQHGVMNTDNMSITGLTIDYGPFGFMEEYDENWIANHSDHSGRYAFNQQPSIGMWNLYALAYSLQDIIPIEETNEIIKGYKTILGETYSNLMLKKIGLVEKEFKDNNLWVELLEIMQESKADYTLTFRKLSDVNEKNDNNFWLNILDNSEKAKEWLSKYFAKLKVLNQNNEERKLRMNKINPKYVFRNWIAETAIRAAEDNCNYSIIDNLINILQNPFDEHEEFNHFASQAPSHLRNLWVSCSS